MVCAFSNDNDDKLIGEGGNSRIYILERECYGMPSAAIKVPKAFVDSRVTKALENYHILKGLRIKTTAFLEECLFDGQKALITENLHLGDSVCLDANAHLQSESDRTLRMLGSEYCVVHTEKEPEEERWFADNKFEKINNIESFVKEHLEFLKIVSDAHLYLAYDCYFFKVKHAKITDIDYIIADWDDVQKYDEDDLFELNKNAFNTALRQFFVMYVEGGDDNLTGFLNP